MSKRELTASGVPVGRDFTGACLEGEGDAGGETPASELFFLSSRSILNKKSNGVPV
jgi:hypothetical protein